MLGKIVHIGLTVKNLEESIHFYKEILGLQYMGQMIMEGPETDLLVGLKNARLKIAYFNSTMALKGPSIELIEFEQKYNFSKPYAKLNNIGISEVCFCVSDLNQTYLSLKEKGVDFLSPPQFFDLTTQGFDKSLVVYFKDNNGIVLELIEPL